MKDVESSTGVHPRRDVARPSPAAVDRLGRHVIPWPTVELDSVAEIRGGATPRRHDPAYWNGDIPWVTPSDLPAHDDGIADVVDSTTSSITEAGLASCSASLLPPGTVLFSSRASIGKIGIASVPLTTNQGFANLIPRPTLNPRYLAWCLHFHADRIAVLAGSTTFKEVAKSALKRFLIPLPSLCEQRRIVEILDQADRLRRLRAKVDAKADRIVPALFVKMFGDSDTNPMRWPVRRFDTVCDSRLGKMLDTKQQTGSHSRPYLRNANVLWDRLDLNVVLRMDFDKSDREEFRLRKGDVLICERGEIGRCASWSDELPECYFQKALHRARPFSSVATTEFVVYLLRDLAKRGVLRRAASKVTFSHLTGIELKELRVPVPPFSLQEDFAAQVRKIKRTLTDRELASARAGSLFRSLLRRAFEGSLTTAWREAHIAEIDREMKPQTSTLAEAAPTTHRPSTR